MVVESWRGRAQPEQSCTPRSHRRTWCARACPRDRAGHTRAHTPSVTRPDWPSPETASPIEAAGQGLGGSRRARRSALDAKTAHHASGIARSRLEGPLLLPVTDERLLAVSFVVRVKVSHCEPTTLYTEVREASLPSTSRCKRGFKGGAGYQRLCEGSGSKILKVVNYILCLTHEYQTDARSF